MSSALAFLKARLSLLCGGILLVLLIVLPLYVGAFWLQVGLLVFAAAIGAVGLTILSGTAGQLSLGHAFFLAVGAYGYSYFSGETSTGSVGIVDGLGLPPLLAAVLAVLAAGTAGVLFSPIASRVRGVYLGVATLALVFIGQHVLLNATSLTGGYNGRTAAPFSLFGFSFSDAHPSLTVLGVAFGRSERLWYLGLALLVLAYLYATNVVRGRPGRAWAAVRDGEIPAAVMGVDVRRAKATAFLMSSMYAGVAGVLLALALQNPVPDYFSLSLSVTYLAMVVLGGLGSIRGAVGGAAFVTALPLILAQYADHIGFLASPGQAGVSPGDFANYVYGGAVVLVILVAPDGVSALRLGRFTRLPHFRSIRSGMVPELTRQGDQST